MSLCLNTIEIDIYQVDRFCTLYHSYCLRSTKYQCFASLKKCRCSRGIYENLRIEYAFHFRWILYGLQRRRCNCGNNNNITERRKKKKRLIRTTVLSHVPSVLFEFHNFYSKMMIPFFPRGQFFNDKATMKIRKKKNLT